MTAPFPPEISEKKPPFKQTANEIYENYAWLALLSDEILKDSLINLKQLAQLGRGPRSHCQHFLDLTAANPGPEGVEAVWQRFAESGITWATKGAMNADMQAIRTAAIALVNFMASDVPEAEILSTRVWPADGTEVEVPNTLPKPHPVESYVQNLRAAYTP